MQYLTQVSAFTIYSQNTIIHEFQWVWLNTNYTLQWCHNGHDGVSNHQSHHCLLNCLFRPRSKKTSKLHVTGLCAGNSPVTGEFLAQRVSNAEIVSIWWRHHDLHISFCKHSSNLSILWYKALGICCRLGLLLLYCCLWNWCRILIVTWSVIQLVTHILMGWCKKDLTPMLTHWSYVFLALTHWYAMSIQWRHNEHHGILNHQSHDCLLNRLFRHRSKKTSKLCVAGLCAGNSPLTREFPAQRASKKGKCFHLMISSCAEWLWKDGLHCVIS